MTRRPKGLVGAAMLVAVVASTPTHARQKTRNIPDNTFDQHAVVPGFGAAHNHHHVPSVRRTRTASPQRSPARVSASTSRDCLHHSARSVLDNLEARFGRVTLVSTCRPGARMPSGDVSLHALNRAFDFKVGKGVDRRDVMVWLGRNSPGVTMSYRNMDHIHTDTGTFHKVIYNAASHEAGERAVAIWQEREKTASFLAALTPLPKPRPVEPAPQPIVMASLGDDAWREEPLTPKPSPVTWGDRRDIFRRYVESKDVVVKPWVTTTCPGGRELPNGLQALLADAASHFRCPVYVNSAYRSPAYNRRVGGARSSEHMKCKAVDFRVACVSPLELKRWVMTNLARWGIGGLGTYRSHVHADVRKATKLVTWTGGAKKRVRYAKHRKPSRYAAAG